MVNRFGVWFVAVAGVLVAVLVVLSVVSALGTEDDGANTTTVVPDETTATTGGDGFAVIDTTVTGWLDPSGDYDAAVGGEGISVTDNTVALPEPEQATDPAAQTTRRLQPSPQSRSPLWQLVQRGTGRYRVGYTTTAS